MRGPFRGICPLTKHGGTTSTGSKCTDTCAWWMTDGCAVVKLALLIEDITLYILERKPDDDRET